MLGDGFYAAPEPKQAPAGGFRPLGIPSSGVSSDYSRTSSHYVSKRARKGKKILFITLSVVLLLLASAAVALGLYVGNINDNLSYKDSKELSEINDSLAPANEGEPFYILLIGADDRENVDGARADTTILARVDAASSQITLISIPRDTAIRIPGHGIQKFNAAYAFDGASGTIDAASELCGVDISYYAEIHFDELVQLVDQLGGIEVDVPIAIDDPDAGGSLEAGRQTLNGEQALIFARSRDYVSGDFQRTTSQRLLIEAAIDKILSLPPTDIPGVIQSLSRCVYTNLKVSDIIGLAMAFQGKGELTFYSAMVPSTPVDVDGVSYVETDTSLLRKMMKVVNEGGNPETVVNDQTVSSSSEAESLSASDSQSYDSYYYEDDGSGYYDSNSGYGSSYYDSGTGYDSDYYSYDENTYGAPYVSPQSDVSAAPATGADPATVAPSTDYASGSDY